MHDLISLRWTWMALVLLYPSPFTLGRDIAHADHDAWEFRIHVENNSKYEILNLGDQGRSFSGWLGTAAITKGGISEFEGKCWIVQITGDTTVVVVGDPGEFLVQTMHRPGILAAIGTMVIAMYHQQPRLNLRSGDVDIVLQHLAEWDLDPWWRRLCDNLKLRGLLGARLDHVPRSRPIEQHVLVTANATVTWSIHTPTRAQEPDRDLHGIVQLEEFLASISVSDRCSSIIKIADASVVAIINDRSQLGSLSGTRWNALTKLLQLLAFEIIEREPLVVKIICEFPPEHVQSPP